MNHRLEIDSIQLAFNNRSILSDIYLKCETGKITGLLGRNGQGKSCLMKIIYGTLSCEKSIRFDTITQQTAFKRPDLLLYLPQFNFIPKNLTLKRIFTDFELDFSNFLITFPEFNKQYHSSFANLSCGERRLIELYVIVKSQSQFAMLDEPFTHLNPLQIAKVQTLLVNEKENKGLLITDHMFRHITTISNDLYVLNNGKTYLTKDISDIESLGYARV
jgi:ABC-type lipopolysaccharide export system ATPase subunit